MSKVLSSDSSSSGNLAPKQEFVNHSEHLSQHFEPDNKYVITDRIKYNLGEITSELKGSISRVDRCKAALSVLASQFFEHVSNLDSVNYRIMAGELMSLRRTHEPALLKASLDEKAAHKVPVLAEAFTKLGRMFRFMQEVEKLDSGFCYDEKGNGVAKAAISDSVTLLRLIRKHGVNMRDPKSVAGAEGFSEDNGLTIRQGNFTNMGFDADFAIHFSTARSPESPILIFFEDLNSPNSKQELIGAIANGQTSTFGRNLIIKSLYGLSMPGEKYFAKVDADVFINCARASRIGLCVSRTDGKLIVSNKLSLNSYDIKSINKHFPEESIFMSFRGTDFKADDGSMNFGKSVYRKTEEPDPEPPQP